MAWTLNGLVTSQVGDKNADLVLPGYGTMPLKKFLKDQLAFDYDFLPAVAAAHVGWVLLFFFCVCIWNQVPQLPEEIASSTHFYNYES